MKNLLWTMLELLVTSLVEAFAQAVGGRLGHWLMTKLLDDESKPNQGEDGDENADEDCPEL